MLNASGLLHIVFLEAIFLKYTIANHVYVHNICVNEILLVKLAEKLHANWSDCPSTVCYIQFVIIAKVIRYAVIYGFSGWIHFELTKIIS